MNEQKPAHKHWEVDSICPNGHLNHISIPEGETMVEVTCKHCIHSKDYLHIVREHTTVVDDNQGGTSDGTR